MAKDIEYYFEVFTRLRTDRNRKYWTAQTCFGAPHKPFLLLSVMDLAGQGQILENLIVPSQDLVETGGGPKDSNNDQREISSGPRIEATFQAASFAG